MTHEPSTPHPDRGGQRRGIATRSMGGTRMSPHRRVPALVLTVALGLGIWAVAFTYTPAAFSDGDVLSAAALNALLNDNFQAASDAVAGRVDRTGDTMTGLLTITPTGTSAGLAVDASGSTGAAAVFNNGATSTTATVGIKNLGTGPALWVYTDQGGNLFEGHASGLSPAIVITANGTIENAVGSGLPIAYGRVTAAGARVENPSTSNWTVTTDTDVTGTRYRITIDDVDFVSSNYTVSLAASTSNPRIMTFSSVGGDLLVYVHDAAGTRVSDTAFSFTVFRPGF